MIEYYRLLVCPIINVLRVLCLQQDAASVERAGERHARGARGHVEASESPAPDEGAGAGDGFSVLESRAAPDCVEARKDE